MTAGTKTTLAQIAPYAVWMALLAVLPPTAMSYAVRTAATVAALVVSIAVLKPSLSLSAATVRRCAWGVLAGFAVFAVWVLPESSVWYRRLFIWGEGGTVDLASSPAWQLAVRFIGSAFVISVAEELFFRKWLTGFAGFWWTVALFAVEHDRWLVAAIAGFAYGLLALRKGIAAAIAAHVTTNLALGIYVLRTAAWQLW